MIKHNDILDNEIKVGDTVFYCYKTSTDVKKRFGKVVELRTRKNSNYWKEEPEACVSVVPVFKPGVQKYSWEKDTPRNVGLSNMIKIEWPYE